MAAKVLGASDKVIEDAHDAFEAIDRGQFIDLLAYGGVATNYPYYASC